VFGQPNHNTSPYEYHHSSRQNATVEEENECNGVIEMVTLWDKIASHMWNDYQLYLQGMGI